MPSQRRYGITIPTSYTAGLGYCSANYLFPDGGCIKYCDLIVVFNYFKEDVPEVKVVVAKSFHSYCRNSLLAFVLSMIRDGKILSPPLTAVYKAKSLWEAKMIGCLQKFFCLLVARSSFKFFFEGLHKCRAATVQTPESCALRYPHRLI